MSGAQVRLVVTDMDGTFLDSENNIPQIGRAHV